MRELLGQNNCPKPNNWDLQDGYGTIQEQSCPFLLMTEEMPTKLHS